MFRARVKVFAKKYFDACEDRICDGSAGGFVTAFVRFLGDFGGMGMANPVQFGGETLRSPRDGV